MKLKTSYYLVLAVAVSSLFALDVWAAEFNLTCTQIPAAYGAQFDGEITVLDTATASEPEIQTSSSWDFQTHRVSSGATGTPEEHFGKSSISDVATTVRYLAPGQYMSVESRAIQAVYKDTGMTVSFQSLPEEAGLNSRLTVQGFTYQSHCFYR